MNASLVLNVSLNSSFKSISNISGLKLSRSFYIKHLDSIHFWLKFPFITDRNGNNKTTAVLMTTTKKVTGEEWMVR